MEDISLHILDIVQNSIIAGANRVEIKIIEDIGKDLLLVEIRDNGQGMDEKMVRKALDPFFTTKATSKVGLGLPLFARAAKEAGGDLVIDSRLGKGTGITATFRYSHIDRKPLGDMMATMSILVVGNPEVDFLYEHRFWSKASVMPFLFNANTVGLLQENANTVGLLHNFER